MDGIHTLILHNDYWRWEQQIVGDASIIMIQYQYIFDSVLSL